MSEDFGQAAETAVAETASPEVATTPEPASIESTMEKAYDASIEKQEKADADAERRQFIRSNTGRFARKVNAVAPAKDPQAVDNQPRVTADQSAVPEQPIGRQAPAAWPREHHAEFSKLSEAAQELVLRREAESHRRITELGQLAKASEGFRQVAERYETLRGADHVQAFETLAAANEYIEKNPVEGLRWLANHYGVSASDIFDNVSQGPDPSHIEALVDQFAQRPNWKEVEGDVLELVPGIQAMNPGKSPAEVMERAYSRALQLNDGVRAQQEADKRSEADKQAKAEAAKRAASARKAASINVKSTVGASPKPTGSWEQTMRETADRLMG